MKKYSVRISGLIVIFCILATAVLCSFTAYAASASEISYTRVSDWCSGSIGKITIKNTGDKEIDQWKLEFDWDKEITFIWNAKVASHYDNHYVITCENWNKIIPKGQSLTFGFLVQPGKVLNEPSGFKLSDIYDELALKDKEWLEYTTAKEAEAFQRSLLDFGLYYGIRFESNQPFTTGYSIMERDPFKNLVSSKYQTVFIPTKDGLMLKGAFFPVPNAKGTMIVLHGRNSNASENIKPIEFLIKSGYQVFLYNARVWNYYKTPKEYVGNITKDIDDVGCAIEYLKDRHDVKKDKLGIYGFSYGASKSIACGSRYPDIKVVLSDASMSYIGDIYGLERAEAWTWWMKTYLNVPLEQEWPKEVYNCIDFTSAIKDIHVPILILHGSKDDVFPEATAKVLYDCANQPKEIHIMPNSGHCNWFLTEDKAAYENTVVQFLDKYLK